MSNQRTHYVTTTDGVTIGGAVHGQGPPLVFLQGVLGDGDLDWNRVVGHLTGRFTCHLPSLRGRGLSGDHPDLSTGRQVDDMLAYVDSIGEPTGLVGWSGGATWALGVAAQSDTVAAVAPFEPGMLSLMDEQEQAAIGAAVARTAELAAEGRLAAAARAFAGLPFNDEEIAVAEDAGYFEAAGRYVPNLLNLLQQHGSTRAPPLDPAVLGAISRSGGGAARIGHQALLHRQRAARGRPRPQRTDTRDPRRRARRPADPSRGARQGTHRVLRASPAAGLTLLVCAAAREPSSEVNSKPRDTPDPQVLTIPQGTAPTRNQASAGLDGTGVAAQLTCSPLGLLGVWSRGKEL